MRELNFHCSDFSCFRKNGVGVLQVASRSAKNEAKVRFTIPCIASSQCAVL